MTTYHLLDGSGFIYRGFHAIPMMRRSDGVPVNAVSGFVSLLLRLMAEVQPTHLGVIFDAKRRNFRHDIFPDYKANRSMPDDLAPQFELVREATLALNLPGIELEGYEADDLLATYARMAREEGSFCVVVSSDKDLMQLVGGGVTLWDPMKNMAIGEAQVWEKFGVHPSKVVDVQALMGDQVDHVPGVPGIGKKIAAELINQFGDLDTLLARAGEIPQKARREKLIANADAARMSRELVRLCDTVPVTYGLDEMDVREPNRDEFCGFLDRMEFRGMLARAEAAFEQMGRPAIGGQERAHTAAVDETDDTEGYAPVDADPLATRPGYFTTKLVSGGPLVAARIWTVDGVRHAAISNGEVTDPAAPHWWPWNRISEARYRLMIEQAEWARRYAPEEPEADPRRPVSASKPNLLPPRR